jgi:hypothetical protein
MKNYDKGILSIDQVIKVFNDSDKRSRFIWLYEFFHVDGLQDFYTQFVEDNLDNSKRKLQEDAIELSIKIKIFKPKYLKVICNIIHSRRNKWIKILALDWLFNFSEEISRNYFADINLHALRFSNNSGLLRAQSIVNLFLVIDSTMVHEELNLLLTTSNDPAIFYRIVNALYKIEKASKKGIEIKNDIRCAIDCSVSLSEAVKTDLLKHLN